MMDHHLQPYQNGIEVFFLAELAPQKTVFQLGGGFKYFLFSSRSLGKIPILTNIFEMGWNRQLANSQS